MFGAGKSIKRGASGATPDQSPTLLDQFAMAALTGLLSNPSEIPGLKSVGDVQKRYAELSFGFAQAMMKAREVQG